MKVNLTEHTIGNDAIRRRISSSIDVIIAHFARSHLSEILAFQIL